MAASEQRGLSTHADAADRYTTHGSGDVVVKRCFGVEMVDTLHHALPPPASCLSPFEKPWWSVRVINTGAFGCIIE